MSTPRPISRENKRYIRIALDALEGLLNHKITSLAYGSVTVEVLFSGGEIKGVKTSDSTTLKESDFGTLQ